MSSRGLWLANRIDPASTDETTDQRGQVQLGWSTTSGGTFNPVGGVQDLYRATSGFRELDLTSSLSLGVGRRYLRFIVTGKSQSSSGRNLFIDYIKLTKL